LHQRNLACSRYHHRCHRLVETAPLNNCLRSGSTFFHKIVLSVSANGSRVGSRRVG
jgi:hypothetical protein